MRADRGPLDFAALWADDARWKSRSLRDDRQRCNGKGKSTRATADPCGMTDRKATARARAKPSADPCGMTGRGATARARAQVQQQIPAG